MKTKLIGLWMMAAILFTGGRLLSSCSNDDNSTVSPTGQVLQDGEWTGSGEKKVYFLLKILIF